MLFLVVLCQCSNYHCKQQIEQGQNEECHISKSCNHITSNYITAIHHDSEDDNDRDIDAKIIGKRELTSH